MVLLNSNAQHIFWLGRYLSRTHFLCARFPFLEDEAAVAYAHAFWLPAFDAMYLTELVLDPTLPAPVSQHFKVANDNIDELRGVLSASGHAELMKLIKTADKDA